MNLTEALDWLFSTQFFGIKLGLENTRKLLATAEVEYLPAKVVHVAGTNGKGSTCAMIEALARAKGYKTGLFTSPHLVDFAERIRVNGEMIADDRLLEGITYARRVAESWEQSPTFFELALMIALRHFKQEGVNFIILETGMGGRLDATNAVPKSIAVLVPIGADHQQYLGDTLAQIAAEKAHIIQYHTPVVTAPQEPEVMAVIRKFALRYQATLSTARPVPGTPQPALSGEHQRANAALAIAAMQILNDLPDDDALINALENVQWPGRFEKLTTPALVLDGAHNEHAARVLAATWQAEFPGQKAALIFAASADKHIREMIPVFAQIAGEWHLVPCTSPRIMPVPEMKELLSEMVEAPIPTNAPLEHRMLSAEQSPLPALAAGSLFLLGDIKAHLRHTAKRATAQ